MPIRRIREEAREIKPGLVEGGRNFVSNRVESVRETASGVLSAGGAVLDAIRSSEEELAEEQLEVEVEEIEYTEGEEVPHYPYVVRGARIFCPYGTHIRKLDMPAAHGSFIRDRPMMNEDDYKVGLDYNIAPFGGCHSPLNDGKRVDITIGEDEEAMPIGLDEAGELVSPGPGTIIEDVKLCEPKLIGKWLDAEKETLVDGKPALTMKCSILCSYACAADADDVGDVAIRFMCNGQGV